MSKTTGIGVTSIRLLIALSFGVLVTGCLGESGEQAPATSTNNAPKEQSTSLSISGPEAVTSGVCTPFLIKHVTSANAMTPLTKDQTVSLQDNMTGAFYTSATCAAAAQVPQFTMLAGQQMQVVYYKTNTAPQSIALIAGNSQLSYATMFVNVSAPPAGTVTQLSAHFDGSSSIAANTCSIFTAELRNGSNPTAAVANTSIALADGAAGVFYSDSGCTTMITSVTIPAGSSLKTFYYRNATSPLTVVFTGTAASLTTGTKFVNITAPTGASTSMALVFGGPSSILASTCSSFSVKTVNETNVITAVTAPTSINVVDNGSGTFYSNSTCTTAITSVSFAAGDSIKVFYYKTATAPQSLTFLGTATSIGGGTHSVAVNPNTANPTALELRGSTSVTAGTCSAAYIAATLNASAQETAVLADTTVSLTGAGAGSFYSDAACTTPITSLTILNGYSTRSFYYKTNGTGTLIFTVDGGSVLTASSLSVTANGSGTTLPTKLLVSGPATSTSGVCSSGFTVSSVDSANTPRNVGSNTTVNLATNGSGSFFSDPTCSSTVTSVQISNGTGSQLFYYKSTAVGSVSLTALDAATTLTSGSIAHSIGAGTPSQIGLAGPASLAVGVCSAYTVTTKDASGNGANVTSSLAVNLSGASPGGFYSDAACTNSITSTMITSGGQSQIIYFKSNSGASLTLSAVDSSSILSTGIKAVTVVAAAPTKLVIAGPSSATAGTCSTFTVSSQDASSFAAPVSSNTTVTLTGNGAGSYYSNAACTTAVGTVTINSGASQATFYFKDATAENLFFSAAAAGLSTATLPFTTSPLAPSKLALVGASSISAGICSFYTIYSQDANGNNSNVAADTAIALSGNAGGQYYSDSACTSIVNSATITSGTSARIIYFKDMASETTTLAGAASGLASASLPIAIVTAAPTKLTMTTAASITAGSCSLVTINSQNDSNIASPVGVNTTVTLTGAGTGSFYTTGACATTTTTATLASGQSSTTVYYKNNSAQSLTFTAATAGLTNGTASVTVNPGAPSVLLLSGAASINVNACTSYVINVQDALSNASTVLSNTVVNLTGAGTGAFYDSSSCSNAISNITISTGNSVATIYYKNTAPQNITINAASGTLTAANLPVTVSTSPPTKLILAASSPTSAGTCLAVSITAQNDSNINSPVSSNSTISLSGFGAGSFYTSSSCSGGAVTSQIMSSGTSSLTLYFQDNTAESVMLSASTGGLTTGTFSLLVNPGNPNKLAFVGPATVNLGVCSSYNVVVQDFYGNTASTATTRIVALSGNGAGTFYSDAACGTSITSTQIAANQSSNVLYFKTTTPASLTFGASTSGLTAASHSVTSAALPPTVLQLTGASSTNANACLMLTVSTVDSNGFASNVAANTTVSLSGAGAGSYYSNAGCTTTATSVIVTSGTSTATVYYKSTAAGSVSLTSTAGGFTASTHSVSVLPGAATSMTLVGSSPIGAGICSLYTLTALDGYSNTAPVGSTTAFSLTGAGSGGYYSDAACGTTILNVVFSGTDSQKFIYYKNNTNGSVTLNASSGGALGSATLPVTINSLSPSKLVISGQSSFTAGSCIAYSVTSQDAYGNSANVVSNTTVNLSGAGPMGFFSNAGCTTAATTVTIAASSNNASFYIKETQASSLMFNVSAAGLNAGTLPVTVQPAAPSKLLLSGSSTISAGSCVALSLTVQDTYDNAATSSSMRTVVLSGAGAGNYYSDAACSTATSSVIFNANVDSSKILYYKDNIAESVTLTAAATGVTQSQQAVTVQPLTPSKVILAGLASFTAGGCQPYTLTTTDSLNNTATVSANTTFALSGGGSIGFFSNAGCTTAITSSTVSSGASTATVYLKETVASSLLLVATASGFTTGTLPVTVQPGAPTTLGLTGNSPITAGVCSVYFVTLKDNLGNLSSPASTQGIVMSGVGNGSFFSNSTCTSALPNLVFSSGTNSQVVYFKDNKAESLTLALSGSGLTGASLPVVVQPGSPTTLLLAGASTVQVQACTPYTLTIKDSLANSSAAQQNYTIDLASTGGGSFYSNAGCTTAVTSVDIATAATQATFYFKSSSAQSVSLMGSTLGLTQGTQTVNVTPLPPSVIILTGLSAISASSCVGYTVTTQDSLGNVSPVTAGTTMSLGGASTGSAFYNDNACTIGVSGMTFNPGTSTQTVYFKSTVNGTFALTSSATSYTQGSQTVTVTGAGGALPSLAFNESSRTVSAGAGQVTLTAVLSAPTTNAVTASYTVGGTAPYPDRFTLQNGTITIPAGSTSTTIQFFVNQMGTPQPSQTVIVTLTSPNNATLGANATDTVTIQDDQGAYLNMNLATSTRLFDQVESYMVTGNTSYVIRSGVLWAWGYNNYGQIGDGTTNNTWAPQRVPAFTGGGVTAVAATGHTTCAIQNGALYCWGRNDNGQVGVGNTTTQYVPVQVIASGVTSVIMAQHTTCAIRNGGVWCWGYNGYGQLGTGSTAASYVPAQVAGLTSGITKIAMGNRSDNANTVCALQNGAQLCWGYNGNGGIGDGSTTQRNVPTSSLNLSSGVTGVTVGAQATCSVKAGAMYCTGYDNWGEVGLGTSAGTVYTTPTLTNLTSGVSQIVSGTNNNSYNAGTMCAIKSGALYCWGYDSGQGNIGDGGNTTRYAPTLVAGLSSGVTSVAMYHQPGTACAVKNGAVLCWGYNGNYNLGDGTTTNRSIPVQVPGLTSGATGVFLSNNNSGQTACAIVGSALYCWGYNPYGGVGNGLVSGASQTTPFSVLKRDPILSPEVFDFNSNHYSNYYDTACLIKSGALYCWGYGAMGAVGNNSTANTYGPTPVPGMSTGVTAVQSRSGHTCAIKDAAVYCWGRNDYYQVGDGTTTQRNTPYAVPVLTSGVTQIMTTGITNCAIKSGALYCWGYGTNGVVGDGGNTHRSTPVLVTGMGSNVTYVAGDYTTQQHICAIQSGALFCWGYNGYYAIGDGTGTSRTVPTMPTGMNANVTEVVMNYNHTCAIKNGSAFCWGYDYYGQGLNGDGGCTHRTAPVQVTGLTTGVTKLMTATIGNISNVWQNYTCAIKDGGMYCWGYNGYGGLGDGTTTNRCAPVAVSGMSSGVTAMAGQFASTCAIKSGSVYCWGYNSNYAVGDGTTTHRSSPYQITALGTGNTHVGLMGPATCAAGSAGIACWGYNAYGEAGNYQTVSNITVPTYTGALTSAMSSIYRQSPYSPSAKVQAGNAHSCVMLNGKVFCWGSNASGQLGDGTTTDRLQAVQVAGLTGVTDLAVGKNHSCATLSTGSLYCWGENTYGQLGVGDTSNRSSPTLVGAGYSRVKAGGNHTCADSGGLYCWGSNVYGELGIGSQVSKTTPQAVGLDVYEFELSRGNTCASRWAGNYHPNQTFCWGDNAQGQLGNGNKNLSMSPVAIATSEDLVSLAMGDYHACGLKTNGSMLCWGDNTSGQLGQGNTTPSLVPIAVPGVGSLQDITAGQAHTCSLTTTGLMHCWGSHATGQLGLGTGSDQYSPVQIPGIFTDAVAISAGIKHGCFVRRSGDTLCTGFNSAGQIGNNTTTQMVVPDYVQSLTP